MLDPKVNLFTHSSFRFARIEVLDFKRIAQSGLGEASHLGPSVKGRARAAVHELGRRIESEEMK